MLRNSFVFQNLWMGLVSVKGEILLMNDVRECELTVGFTIGRSLVTLRRAAFLDDKSDWSMY